MRFIFSVFSIILCGNFFALSAQAALEVVYPITTVTTYSSDLSQEIVVEADPSTVSLSINGSQATLRSDNRYSVRLVFLDSGLKSLAISATDGNGNISTLNSSFDFQYDAQAPTIVATQPTPVTTSQSVLLSASVTDTSPVRLNVYRNSALVFSQDTSAINQSFQLQEGNNVFKLVATDRAGNSSESVLNPIRRDTEAPSLLSYSPADGTIVNDLTFQLSGTFNESLQSLTINAENVPLGNNGQTFSKSITYSQYGPSLIQIVMVDLAGNSSTFNVPVEVVDSIGEVQEPSVIINANNLHTCTTVNGAAYCWGWNGWGQLGDNSFVNRSSPIVVPTLGQNVKLAKAGAFHSCAVLNDNSMKCWGRNDFGEVGNRQTGSANNPTSVIFDAPLNIQDIALGNGYTCVMYQAGSSNGVKCWGRNSQGQLGNNSTTNSLIPVDVSGLQSGVKHLTTSSTHLCVIKSDDSLHCWGENGGKIGNNSTANVLVPTAVNNLSGAISVAAGVSHTCAINLIGEVYCWGQNNQGQVGNGSTGTVLNPVKVVNLTQAATDVSAGISNSCAIMADQSVKCWGSNTVGELGIGSFSARSTTPVDVVSLGANTGAISISSSSHSCALLPTAFKCWGRNTEGQLGDGTFVNRNTPVTVLNLVVPPPSQAPIVANFVVNPIRSTPMMSVSFDASSTVINSGSVSSYSWKFGDSTTGSGLNVSHTYQNEGNYLVELTVTSGSNQQYKISKYLVVESYRLPIAALDILPTPNEFSFGFSALNSIGLSGNIIAYEWDFGDGVADNGVIVNHSYAAHGIYTVTLKVRDDNSNETTVTQVLNVKDLTAPLITISSPTEGQTIATQNFTFSGSSNEKLSKIRLNGIEATLDASGLSFSKTFSSLENQSVSFYVEATDLAGNITNKTINVSFNYDEGPFTINVNPSIYSGTYKVNSSLLSGISQAILPSGSHSISIGTFNVSFNISNLGVISNVVPAEALTVNGRNISFNAFNVSIDPNLFSGFFSLDGSEKFTNQIISRVLLAGQHNIQVGDNTISFFISALGDILNASIPSALEILGSTIKFSVADITINPNGYLGYYSIFGVNETDLEGDFLAVFQGSKIVKLIKGLNYPLFLGNYPVYFEINSFGSALSLSPNSIEALGSVLKFLTSTAQIDVDGTSALFTTIVGQTTPLNPNNGVAEVILVNDTEVEFDFYPREQFTSGGRNLEGLCSRIGNFSALTAFKSLFCYKGFGTGKGGKKCKWYQKCKWGKWFNGSWNVSVGNPFSGLGNTLKFINTDINLDVGNFLGDINIPGVDRALRNLRLPIDVALPMLIGESLISIVRGLDGLITGTIDGLASTFNTAFNILNDTIRFITQDVLLNSEFMQYFLYGVGGALIGAATVALIPGVVFGLGVGAGYALVGTGIGALAPLGAAYLPFVVGTSGLSFLVDASLYNIAVNGFNAILNSLPVTIDPSGFIGNYFVSGFLEAFLGQQTIHLLPNVEYFIRIGANDLKFIIDNLGNVLVNDPLSLFTGQNLLGFRTTPINIDVGNYLGNWGVDYALYSLIGDQTLHLVNNLAYQITIGQNLLEFFVNGNGLISTDLANSIAVVNNALNFLTTQVNIDLGNFLGRWTIEGVLNDLVGSQTIDLIPGLPYSIEIANNPISFFLNNSGVLENLSNSLVGFLDGANFNFFNIPIRLKYPSGSIYNIVDVLSGLFGTNYVDLIPNIPYTITSGDESATFIPTELGILPDEIVLPGGVMELDEFQLQIPTAGQILVVKDGSYTPMPTLKRAAKYAEDNIAQMILVGPGTYNEVMNLNKPGLGIKIKGFGNPIVSAFKLTDINDVDIEGFVLNRTERKEHGILLKNVTKFRITGNRISKPAPGKNGIVVDGYVDFASIGNNQIVENNYNGIVVNDRVQVLIIEGNEISSNGRNGVRFNYEGFLVFQDNIIQNNGINLEELGGQGYGINVFNLPNDDILAPEQCRLLRNIITNNRGKANRKSTQDISNYREIVDVSDTDNQTTTNIEFNFSNRQPANQ